jgi:hypothetical protein
MAYYDFLKHMDFLGRPWKRYQALWRTSRDLAISGKLSGNLSSLSVAWTTPTQIAISSGTTGLRHVKEEKK